MICYSFIHDVCYSTCRWVESTVSCETLFPLTGQPPCDCCPLSWCLQMASRLVTVGLLASTITASLVGAFVVPPSFVAEPLQARRTSASAGLAATRGEDGTVGVLCSFYFQAVVFYNQDLVFSFQLFFFFSSCFLKTIFKLSVYNNALLSSYLAVFCCLQSVWFTCSSNVSFSILRCTC